MSFESESVTICGNKKFETHVFRNVPRIFKSVSITGLKHRILLSLAVKNLVCLIYFKELLQIGAKYIQIEQVLQIRAKLLLTGAELLQIRKGITN